MKKQEKYRSCGRPLGENRAKSKNCKILFEYAESYSLTLRAIQNILATELGDDNAPSYRTLQEWRRGTHIPRFAPFDTWLTVLKKHREVIVDNNSNKSSHS